MKHELKVIVVGGSAGSVDALTTILPELPAGFPLPVVIVLHLPPHRPAQIVAVLAARVELPVKEAEDKEPLRAGTIYVAPPDYHLLIERGGTLALSADEPVYFSRPSIDVLFESAADALGAEVLGVLLSGANGDGARGLAAIREAGGRTVVQSPQTSMVSTMPASALALGVVDRSLPLPELGTFLARLSPFAVEKEVTG